MVEEYPEKPIRVVFRRRKSAWSDTLQDVIEYDELYWSTGAVTWKEIKTE